MRSLLQSSAPSMAQPLPGTPLLVINGLSRRYGRIHAVEKINLNVYGGEIFALLGAKDSGKSTLLRMLSTLLPPTAGDALVAGYSILSQAEDVRRVMGHVPPEESVDGALTGQENLQRHAQRLGLEELLAQERIREALGFMGLSRDGDRLVGDYTRGMVRRLEIAQASLHRPRVLLLDEPTLGLDPLARGTVWNHLLDLRANCQLTLVFSTSSVEEAQGHADRVGILQAGRLEAVGSIIQLLASSPGGGSLGSVCARWGIDAATSR